MIIPKALSKIRPRSPRAHHGIGIATLLSMGMLTSILGGSVTHWLTLRSHPDLSTILHAAFEPETATFSENTEGIQECTVTLISGRKITGELVEQSSRIVIVSINNIETTFQRDRIASVIILPPVSRRFVQMRDAIPDDDIDSRLSLVEWLRERHAYTLAIRELESILLTNPNSPRAKLIYRWLTEYNKLSIAPSEKPTQDQSNPETPARSRKPQRNRITPLTKEQINLIRVYEIDLRNPPKLEVPDETIQTLIRRHPNAFSPNENERKAIFKLPEIDKLRLLFTHKARDLYTQIQILEDPYSMELFRAQVHNQRGWIINACATTRCHGGVDAGRFQLINTHPNAIETVYTNFSIIENYTLDNGTSLIDYNDPQRSPLLQMAMIEKNALTPHPEIPQDFRGAKFRPIFKSTRDRKYRDAIEWIRAMYQPRPEYGFDTQTRPEPKPSSSSNESKPTQSAP